MSGSGSGRHAAPERGGAGRRTGALVAAAVVLVALVAAAVTGWPVSMPWSGDVTTAQPGATTSTTPEATPSASASPSTGADTGSSDGSATGAAGWLRNCAAKVAGEEKVVAAAADGVRHWHSHVQARTDMFAGRISQDRMHQIWTRSKLAGPDDQRRFAAAVDAHPASSPCSEPADVPSGVRVAADDCQDRSTAAARAVEAAHAVMHDWEKHLANMASFADGGMSQTMAQDRWVASWRSAPTHIDAYRAARSALRDSPACSGRPS